MDTIFVKRYVAKGELPKANGWYTIKFSNSDKQRIEQLRFDISRKKFHDDESEFDHVEYWLDEMTLSAYLSSMLPTGSITTTNFSNIIFSDSEYKVRDCFALAEQMTAKALEKRDLEWWEHCILNDAVAPNPQAGKKWLATSNSYHEKLIREEYKGAGYKSIEHFQEEASKKYGYKNYEIATSQADTDTYGKINFEAGEAFSAHLTQQRIENKKPSHENRNYEGVEENVKGVDIEKKTWKYVEGVGRVYSKTYSKGVDAEKLAEAYAKELIQGGAIKEWQEGWMKDVYKYIHNQALQSNAGGLQELQKWVEEELIEWKETNFVKSTLERVKNKIQSLTPKPQDKNDAVDFVKWIRNSDWQFSRENENCLDIRAGNLIHGIILETKTIQEVYQLFKKYKS